MSTIGGASSFLYYYMDLPRKQRTDSLRKLTFDQQRQSSLSPNRSQAPLNNLIDEVLKHLMEIIEVLLSEENSNNYIEFMNKVQQMCQQNEKKIMIRLEQRLEQFSRGLTESGINNKKQPLIAKQSTLRNQRKNITQSILTISKSPSKQFGQQRSADLIKTATNLGSKNRAEQILEEQGDKTMVNSMDLHSLNARLSQVEQNHGKRMKDLGIDLESKVKQSIKEVNKVKEQAQLFRLKMEEKLECSLQALWNVVTDMRADLAPLANQ